MNSFFCMLGLHQYRNWQMYKEVRIVGGDDDQYTYGYKYFYKAACKTCGEIKHKTERVS